MSANPKRGEVYYIMSYPTHGNEQRSGRPAVIVSNDLNNKHSNTYEICFMTLQEKPNIPTHVTLDRGPCINSTILCEQVSTVTSERVGSYMCTLSEDQMDLVDKAIMISLGLSSNSESSLNSSDETDEQVRILMEENISFKHELDSMQRILEDYNSIKAQADMYEAKADMYERMYNDLLDRLMKRV